MSTLRVLDTTGDTELEWTVTDVVSLEQARKVFNDMVKAGFVAYAINTPAEGKRVNRSILYDFDVLADEIVLTPLLRGG